MNYYAAYKLNEYDLWMRPVAVVTGFTRKIAKASIERYSGQYLLAPLTHLPQRAQAPFERAMKTATDHHRGKSAVETKVFWI